MTISNDAASRIATVSVAVTSTTGVLIETDRGNLSHALRFENGRQLWGNEALEAG